MSAILDALVNELIDGDDSALARLADKLAPLLVDRLVAPATGEGWLRGADEIAAYIGSPRSRVYALASARRIPVQRDGSALVARRSELDSWLQNGGGSGRNARGRSRRSRLVHRPGGPAGNAHGQVDAAARTRCAGSLIRR